MKITVIPGQSLTADHVARWSAIQQSNPDLASPYFRPEFTQAVAAAREDVRVAILEDSGEIAAFFPFHPGRFGIGRPVGLHLSDYQALIAKTGFAFDARQLLRASGLCAWDFDHLLASQLSFAAYHRSRTGSPFLDLSAGYDEYAAARRRAGSEQIKKTGTLMRKFEREHGPLRFEPHVATTDAFDVMMRLKSEQLIRTGNKDLFAEKWVCSTLRRIDEAQGTHFAGMLSVLYAKEQIAAIHFGMRSKTVWHYWFPVYDQAFYHYSPGLILLLKMAQHAPSVGLRSIDLGKGETMYKQRLMSGEVELAEGSVELPTLVTISRRLRRETEQMLRRSPLAAPARGIVRALRRGRHPTDATAHQEPPT